MKPALPQILLSLALLTTAIPTIAAAPEQPARPLIPLLKPSEIMSRCTQDLDSLRNRVQALANMTDAEAQEAGAVFLEWNKLQIALEDLQGPVALLMNVSPDANVRKNAEPCMVNITKFAAELYQNEKLYQRIKTTQPRDSIEKKLRQDILDSFDDTGVSLPPAKQARMKAIMERLTQIKQEFARNIRDNRHKISLTPEQMAGLPENFLTKAKRDSNGNYLLGFEYTEFHPFMQYADSEPARKHYLITFINRGTPKNLQLMKEAVVLRQEMAALFGMPSYADYALRRRMAGKPDAVNKFLAEVLQAVTAQERSELDELRAFRAKTTGMPLAQTKIERWDTPYWQQKMKKALYAVDQNALRKYFPTDASVKWTMAIASTLYGVQFKQAKVPVWHKDVQYFDVIDSKTLARIGGVYIDLFPREGKYGHAAAFGTRGSSSLAQRTPISVLVANFNREGLDSTELETLLHEFGHILHGVLSKTRYVDHAGTSVERDFVEAPSQMFEEWARNKEPLAMLPAFCTDPCPAVDNDLLQRLKAAHNFGRGIRYARQHLYASFDMNLHQKAVGDPLALWQQMEGATPQGYVAGTEFPGQFSHLLGGYAAGYYGYMWSEVIALDMLSRYDGQLLNPEIGHAYRQAILERGGELHGSELVRGFLGREPSSKAFFEEISGKQKK
ncbi:MAG: M3 family metallopeptidase [Burkholderiaceae bacterium]|nr:M3 family metallopeptidase [Burkholderiaceae bacterium]